MNYHSARKRENTQYESVFIYYVYLICEMWIFRYTCIFSNSDSQIPSPLRQKIQVLTSSFSQHCVTFVKINTPTCNRLKVHVLWNNNYLIISILLEYWWKIFALVNDKRSFFGKVKCYDLGILKMIWYYYF